jgi:xanthine dehydrogenase accessory factor
MREFLTEINRWLETGGACCVATVVQTWGSAPRPAGSQMFIHPDGAMLGSVSGGCVEGAVLREAAEVFATGQSKTLQFGVSDDSAWSVGLTCGGQLEVFLERLPGAVWPAWQQCLAENRSCVFCSNMVGAAGEHILFGPENQLLAGELRLPDLASIAQEALLQRKSHAVEISGERWFVRPFPRKDLLLLIGAAHVASEVVHLAQYFDFETVVIDPRGTFARHTHFPTLPDRIIEEYPAEVLAGFPLDAFTFALLLAHDPKIDDQALSILLRSDVAYIGAMSSRKSHEKRRERLRDMGFSDDEIGRIRAPVGLPIRSRTAREIALSIVAELVAVRNGQG